MAGFTWFVRHTGLLSELGFIADPNAAAASV